MSRNKLYEGKAKILYSTEVNGVLLVEYKDAATAFNAQKQGVIPHKGEINCGIASKIFEYLGERGIKHHFLQRIAPNQMLVQAVQIIPLEVVVRNMAAGSLCKRLGIDLGRVLPQPIVEFYYKNDALGDPLVLPSHIYLLELATPEQLSTLEALALEINGHLKILFQAISLILVDFKLEFGTDGQGHILLSDEISPDSCRLWDDRPGAIRDRIMDKDRFRQDLGKIAETYQEVARRLAELDLQSIAKSG
ncbi:MAG: phosphoribosylaminoimidazolesuccinocarboxamide synthase [Pseudanabaenaceae cyanobacterium]